MKIKVGVSARHVHLTEESLEILFGEGYTLHKKKDLSQPLQFAAEEVVTVKTEKGEIPNVRILGPVRSYNQVEISRTDAFKLGRKPPVRDSGDILDSESVTLVGPKGEIELADGCIISTRHIHLTEEDAKKYDLSGDEVMVRVSTEKGGILEHVRLKIADHSYFELHLDTDDANAHFLSQGDEVEIIKEK